MTTPRLFRSLFSNMCTFILVAFVAGCGGGSGDTSFSNTPPPTTVGPSVTANPGKIVAVRVGNMVTLDGSGSSTTTSDSLNYAWAISSKPDGSAAVLTGETTANPTFFADVVGTYRVQLVVTAGSLTSQRTVALVEVTNPGDYLTGIRDHTSYSSQCSDCHDGRFAAGDGPIDPVPPKAGDHPATTNLCQGCHTTFGFTIHTVNDHVEALSNCSFCHNGVVATGKSIYHQATPANSECDDCHNTVSFLTLNPDGTYDHTGITTGCVRCHDGSRAIGKTTPQVIHDSTDVDCSYCHTPAGFTPAYPDHSVFVTDTTRCDSCHNPSGGGVNATNQPVGHPIMTRADMAVEDCRTCHSVNLFSLGGVFPHRLIDPTVLACKTCHNDDPANSINARGTSSDPTPPHPTIDTKDCAGCHSTDSFFPAFAIDHTEQVVIDQACKDCHVPDGTGSAQGLSVNHMPYDTVTVDCESCHAPPGGGTFTTGYFDHAAFAVTNNCQTCHNDTIVSGKPGNHIPTTPADQDCVVCHQATVTNNFVNFTGGLLHANVAVTNNCQTCHDGVLSTGKGLNHIPTTPDNQDCVACHKAGTFVDFTDGNLHAYTTVTSNCASCHNGSYVTSGAIVKKVNHIPAQQECSQCHIDTTVTGGFANTIFYTNVHTNFANGCEGCHSTTYFPLPSAAAKDPATHLPTAQDCHYCHINQVPGGFLAVNSIFNHTGISGNCVSCHDGSTKNRNAGARGTIDDPTPPHQVIMNDCNYCHNTTNFADAYPDHTIPPVVGNRCDFCHNGVDATGKIDDPTPPHVPVPLVGGVEQDCSVCHVPGAFKPSVFDHTGITNNCASCHDGSVSAVTTKPVGHPPTIVSGVDRDCSYCHNTTAFAGAKYDHTGITNNCVSCHDGNPIIGKHGTHVPTNEDCVICHQTTGFIPALFNHTPTQINNKRCDTCHNGVFATGKIDDPTPPHVTTIEDCGYCHSFNNPFSTATFNHTGITSGCNASGCHTPTGDGRYYVTPPHVDPAGDCVDCHAVDGAFLDGKYDHSTVVPGTCANSSCHGPGGIGTQQPPNGPTGHFDTAVVSCDRCHNTTTWLNTSTFDHCPGTTANSNSCTPSTRKYPGDHRAGKTTCKSCHTDNTAATVFYPYPTDTASPPKSLIPECAACHRNRFKRVGKHIGGENGTIYQNRDCSNGGSGCHRVSDSGF